MRTALEEDNDNMVSELERKVRIECGGAAELVAIGGLTSQCPRCSRIAPHLDRPIAFGLAPPQVAALKGATQSIHDEVSEQNRMLGGMVRAALEHHGTGGKAICGTSTRRSLLHTSRTLTHQSRSLSPIHH